MTGIQAQLERLSAELQADPFGPTSSIIAAKIQRLRCRQEDAAYAERCSSGAYGLAAQLEARS